eukprot:TRINITY_DN2695_c0_g1_i2.p1 TRINITY_DN2695_c0_g1~~TRINITY_DN2695_c0_g1_i2.p1  ORF type:complete len:182 (+),score=38.40 TRINITY_DN2695_c0_g1_i2:345-890(+)
MAFSTWRHCRACVDIGLKDTCVREWEEESLGDPRLEWDTFFSVPIDHKRVHTCQHLYHFYFVPVRPESLKLGESRGFFDIVPAKPVASYEPEKNLDLFHQGKAEFAEMDRLAWIRVDGEGKLNVADMKKANDNKMFPRKARSAFDMDVKLLAKNVDLLQQLKEEWSDISADLSALSLDNKD